MPVTKNKYARWHIIDQCLRNKTKRWAWKDLQSALEKKDILVSRRTIFQDINDMNTEYAAHVEDPRRNLIEFDRSRKTFYYTVEGFSITKFPVKQEDYAMLREIFDIFKQFEEIPQMDGMSNLLLRLQQMFNFSLRQLYPPIQFEKLPPPRGIEFLSPLYQHITNKNVLKIYYTPFQEPTIVITVHPYLLKEYNHRWYLIGWNENARAIHNYPLDRIDKILVEEEKTFYFHLEFDPNSYYRDIIGVTLHRDKSVEDIELLFEKRRAQYVITKPVHDSQHLLGETEEGVRIGLRLIPNQELEAWILGFGNDVSVIKPLSLADKIKERLKKSLEKYDKILIS